jgi:hypothetical protein
MGERGVTPTGRLEKRTHAPQQFYRYLITPSGQPSSSEAECLRGFREGISIDRNFKFDAAQQLRAVVQLCAVARFNFSLFHFYHTLVNSSSRSCEQAEQIL